MWIIGHLRKYGQDPTEEILAEQFRADAAGCTYCLGVLQATGWLPACCPECGRKRDRAWQESQERAAAYTLAARKGNAQ